jgi:hypothetical protein
VDLREGVRLAAAWYRQRGPELPARAPAPEGVAEEVHS